jgi:hypothetical protein
MNLKLRITKHYSSDSYIKPKHIRFAIIDLDRSPEYPINFVCNLPKSIKLNERQPSNFSKTFGDKKMEMARNLLNAALENEDDLEIKAEIETRLKTLPK